MRFSIAWLVLTGGIVAAQTPGSCEKLKSLALPEATVTTAESVAAGGRGGAQYKNLPAFCRVAATLTPSTDSDIKIEVWLPASQWNGKFQAVGNGAWAGVIGYPAMARALASGYATASTDTGHSTNGGSFALGHPEKLTDFAWRAVHEMTVKAKMLASAYYGSAPKLSYWNGCSTGGRQGLKEAQKFPADFDGIIAGAPANYWTHLAATSIWIAQAVHKDEASYIPTSKYSLIHKAVLEACDALDGVKDGVIDDPTRCHFDPKVLACKGDASADSCLSAPQVEAVRKIYSASKNSRTGQEIFPALEPGSELGWSGLAGPQPFSVAPDHFKYVVFKNPEWDWHTLNFDSDITLADRSDNELINASGDVKAFVARGGKLLMYHGWTDQLIPPENSIHYYESVKADSVRLFMAPGMNHCAGGDGPNTFDAVGAIEQWVEQKKAPEQMIAAHTSNGAVDRTRPLCPYPQVARYKGSGSTDDAANFTCKAP
jgi:feruloyl esterase